MKFNKYIKDKMDFNNINFTELSNLLGFSIGYTSEIISGKKTASLKFINRVVDIFHLSDDERKKIEGMVASDKLELQAKRLKRKLNPDKLLSDNEVKIYEVKKDWVTNNLLHSSLINNSDVILSLDNDVFEFKKGDYLLTEEYNYGSLKEINNCVLFIKYKDKKVIRRLNVVDDYIFLRSSFEKEDTVTIKEEDINEVRKITKLIRSFE